MSFFFLFFVNFGRVGFGGLFEGFSMVLQGFLGHGRVVHRVSYVSIIYFFCLP